LRSSATHFPAIWFKFKQKIMQKIKLILVFASNFGKSQSLNYFCIIMKCSFFFLRIFLILAPFFFICVAEDLKCRPQVVRNHRGPCVLYDQNRLWFSHFPAIWFKFKQKIMQKIKLILVFASNFGKSQSLNYFCIMMTCSFFFLRIFLILAPFFFICVAEDLKCRPQVVRNHRGPCVLYDRGNCKDSARDGIRQI
jgi:hypothetical protein